MFEVWGDLEKGVVIAKSATYVFEGKG